MSCSICGEEVSDNAIRIEKDGVTHLYCCSGCLYESPELEGFRHRNISSIVLNKTLFEVLAIITGFGGGLLYIV